MRHGHVTKMSVLGNKTQQSEMISPVHSNNESVQFVTAKQFCQ